MHGANRGIKRYNEQLACSKCSLAYSSSKFNSENACVAFVAEIASVNWTASLNFLIDSQSIFIALRRADTYRELITKKRNEDKYWNGMVKCPIVQVCRITRVASTSRCGKVNHKRKAQRQEVSRVLPDSDFNRAMRFSDKNYSTTDD